VTDHHIARSSHDHVELKGRHTDSIRIQESRNAVLREHGAGAAMALNVDGARSASEKGHGQEGKDAELHPTKMTILAQNPHEAIENDAPLELKSPNSRQVDACKR
jgi:hypothetical protein